MLDDTNSNPLENSEPTNAASGTPAASGTSGIDDVSSTDNVSHLTEAEINKRQKELQDYRLALEQELTVKAKDAPTENLGSGLEFFQKQLPGAFARIAHLAEYSTSDAIMLSANKYMIECVRRGYVDSPADPVNEILKQLKANSRVDPALNDRATS